MFQQTKYLNIVELQQCDWSNNVNCQLMVKDGKMGRYVDLTNIFSPPSKKWPIHLPNNPPIFIIYYIYSMPINLTIVLNSSAAGLLLFYQHEYVTYCSLYDTQVINLLCTCQIVINYQLLSIAIPNV